MPKRIKREQHEPEDYHIGKRIRQARLAKGLRLEDLANQMGLVTWQQLQKYETGANRITASMLYKIALHLRVHPIFFYSGLEDPLTGKPMEAFNSTISNIARQIEGLDPAMVECIAMIVSRVCEGKATSGGI